MKLVYTILLFVISIQSASAQIVALNTCNDGRSYLGILTGQSPITGLALNANLPVPIGYEFSRVKIWNPNTWQWELLRHQQNQRTLRAGIAGNCGPEIAFALHFEVNSGPNDTLFYQKIDRGGTNVRMWFDGSIGAEFKAMQLWAINELIRQKGELHAFIIGGIGEADAASENTNFVIDYKKYEDDNAAVYGYGLPRYGHQSVFNSLAPFREIINADKLVVAQERPWITFFDTRNFSTVLKNGSQDSTHFNHESYLQWADSIGNYSRSLSNEFFPSSLPKTRKISSYREMGENCPINIDYTFTGKPNGYFPTKEIKSFRPDVQVIEAPFSPGTNAMTFSDSTNNSIGCCNLTGGKTMLDAGQFLAKFQQVPYAYQGELSQNVSIYCDNSEGDIEFIHRFNFNHGEPSELIGTKGYSAQFDFVNDSINIILWEYGDPQIKTGVPYTLDQNTTYGFEIVSNKQSLTVLQNSVAVVSYNFPSAEQITFGSLAVNADDADWYWLDMSLDIDFDDKGFQFCNR